jgi:hypothetical protein
MEIWAPRAGKLIKSVAASNATDLKLFIYFDVSLTEAGRYLANMDAAAQAPLFHSVNEFCGARRLF